MYRYMVGCHATGLLYCSFDTWKVYVRYIGVRSGPGFRKGGGGSKNHIHNGGGTGGRAQR